MFKELNPLLHSQLRLAIMSILIEAETAEFTFIKKETKATAGNLSVQVNKLKDAGYITIEKKFKGNYPQTLCSITETGIDAFEDYVSALKGYINKNT